MNVGVRNRIRRLGSCDRLLLLLTAGWSIAGVPGNYARVHGLTGTVWHFLSLEVMLLWTVIAGVIAYSMIRQQRRPADYGFSLKRGGVLSLAVIALIHAYLAISGKLVLSGTAGFLWSAVGALMEEVVFRAVAIKHIYPANGRDKR